uniref:Vitamin k-dependent gamma-carboxylase n=1 Tax=Tetraselmis sp. GSL018 TaxID=582737 RepID=A0A061SAH3_9CHLO|mmetsp:Transcript_6781/g.16360  ORF Transcript_6781/g.16360 Transcript_6781/m.16360 type:complete len:578 (+) Transcript_6781:170-1903(+)|eukprot:CAMPEP_0177588814 /NCGR_PEP_ID=MMETSP0419_2-20121207/6440_1 /TAXON_ID=582737 /ORGANISM="Tetraselmis sp., Strain GSL018" /LENGTH=577 /DNA_ID=CAMNT_0019079065 /DNA_START=222 /DNA_END=1955 /DNA_ORIENTATION=-
MESSGYPRLPRSSPAHLTSPRKIITETVKSPPPPPARHSSQRLTALLQSYVAWLEVPVHSSTIAVFRMLYALCVLAQLAKWQDMFVEFHASYVVLPYPGMGWVRPLSVRGGSVLLGTCAAAAVLQLVGLATAAATPVMWLTFAWLFHICESNHNNHYLLMCHVLFVGSFIGWGRWMSLDQAILARLGRRRDPRVPRWHLLAMRLLFSIPYLYGAFAKMNHDWLFRAQPLIMWFEPRGGLYSNPLFPWFIAWSGMLFDLVIAFLLFYRKTRYIIAFPAAVFFNTCNKIMFNIGVFPLMMIASLILFLEPHHPAQLVAHILRRKAYGLPDRSEDGSLDGDSDKLNKPRAHERRFGPLTARQWWTAIFFTSFCTFHALFPLRHFVLYRSNPSWTEEGHFGAWHMKLRSKRGSTVLIIEEMNGMKHMLAPAEDNFVNNAQKRKLEDKPHVLLLYVGRLKMVFEAASRPLKSVKVMSCFALNSRPSRQLYIPTANLLDYVGKYELIGVTGVGKWIYADGEGPLCKPQDLRIYNPTEARKTFDEIHTQAGVFSSYGSVTHRKEVTRRVADGVFEEAYLWPMFE